MKELTFLIFLIQALSIGVSVYLMILERKYCKEEKWYWGFALGVVAACELIPVLGIFMAIGACADSARCISNTIDKKIGGRK